MQAWDRVFGAELRCRTAVKVSIGKSWHSYSNTLVSIGPRLQSSACNQREAEEIPLISLFLSDADPRHRSIVLEET